MRKVVAIAMVACLAGSAALAEPPTGSRLGERTEEKGLQYNEEESADSARKMAICMVQKRIGMSRAYVMANSREEAAANSAPLFKSISCLSFIQTSHMSDTSVVHFPDDVLRGMLAEALLAEDGKNAASLPVLPVAKDYSRKWFAATSRNAVIDEMAVCMAETNPAGIVAMLRTEAYSKEERAAFGAITPNLATCLRVGAKLQANRQALRAALADALYQRVMRPAPVAPEPAAPATAN